MADNLDEAADPFGPNLRRVRESVGLTQKDVAQRVGITEAGYRHYEANRAKPAVDDLDSLAMALGLRSRELFERLGLIGGSDEEMGIGPSVYAIATSIDETADLLPEDKELLLKMIWRAFHVAEMARSKLPKQ